MCINEFAILFKDVYKLYDEKFMEILNMSSKFTTKKKLNNKRLSHGVSQNGDYEKVVSFNKKTTYSFRKTKYLIVGTLSPYEGRMNGYFYTSKNNEMFEYIDASCGSKNSLKELKDKLERHPKDWNTIKKIKKTLKKRKIAFLDVIKKAIASKTSARDDDICEYVLDYGSFRRINYEKVKIVANSKNAKTALEHILDKIGKSEYKQNIELIPQKLRGYTSIYKTKNGLKNAWFKFLV